jgi:hypothetical protein
MQLTNPTELADFLSHFDGNLLLLILSIWVVCLFVLAIVFRAYVVGIGRYLFIKSQFGTVAKHCGLTVKITVRKGGVQNGNFVVRSEIKESFPKIRFGKPLPKFIGVTWTLKPAKGSTIEEIASRSEALAAGLKVRQVRVERKAPNTGTLTVIFGNPLA